MILSRVRWMLLACAPFVAVTANAHHSVALQYDMFNEVTISGTITAMSWRNPHSWLDVEVVNEDGVAEIWKVEFGSANALYRRGWRQDDLPVGAQVTIHGLPARDGSNQIEGDQVVLADGRELFSGAGPDD